MELEEAIKDVKRICEYLKESDYMSIDKDTKISLETLLNHLTKQEKMIELMVQTLYDEDYEKLICMEVDCDHVTIQQEGKCIGKDCIKEYFEKKAEEQLTDENKG